MAEYIVLVLAAVAVITVAKFLAWPIKKIIKLAINTGLGALMIVLVNSFGGAIGITIPFNLLTAFLVGILGVPGVIILIIIGFFM